MQRFTPVVPTQGIYRTLLQAMAHPCRPYDLDSSEFDSPLHALARTLLDHEVSFAVHPNAPAEWSDVIFTATKARMVPLEEADFLFVSGNGSDGTILQAKRGEPAFPDLGATLVYVMDSPSPDPGPSIKGPGLRRDGPPECNPFSESEWEDLMQCNADYPMGVDALVLIRSETVCALPRSTRISPDPLTQTT